jgi:hypothetical protein
MDMWASTKTVRIIRLLAAAATRWPVLGQRVPLFAGKKKPAGKSGLNPIH